MSSIASYGRARFKSGMTLSNCSMFWINVKSWRID